MPYRLLCKAHVGRNIHYLPAFKAVELCQMLAVGRGQCLNLGIHSQP